MSTRLGLGLALPNVGGLINGWTPAKLGASLLGWWDAERIDSLTLSGTAASAWTDLVAGITPTQAVSGSRPRWDANLFGGVLNKCANTNINPQSLAGTTKGGDAAATLALVDDSAALAAIGLTGNAYVLDNSAGAGSAWVTFSGATGNTNPHAATAYVRGAGQAQVRTEGQVATAVALTGAYVRRATAQTPGFTTTRGEIQVAAGAVVYFTLNGLYEGADPGVDVRVFGASGYGFGRPGLLFDGADDTLGLVAALPYPELDVPSELWVLCDQQTPVADATTRGVGGYSGGSTSTGRSLRRQVAAGVSRGSMGVGDGTTVSTLVHTLVNLEGRHVMRGVAGLGSKSIDVDATVLANGPQTIGSHSTDLRIGSLSNAANFWQGTINSFLITGPLSDPDAALMFKYLKARGGIA